MNGYTYLSSRCLWRLMVPSVRSVCRFKYSLAKSSKVFAWATLSVRRSSAGLIPSAMVRRASSRRSRAIFKDTSGNWPRLTSFSLPARTNFKRHKADPLGLANRNSPRSSNRFNGLSWTYAARMADVMSLTVNDTKTSQNHLKKRFLRVRFSNRYPNALGYPLRYPQTCGPSEAGGGRMWQRHSFY
jgi:hypothetical protein